MCKSPTPTFLHGLSIVYVIIISVHQYMISLRATRNHLLSTLLLRESDGLLSTPILGNVSTA